MDEKKDKGLQGNEKIEEAILALQQEPTEELLAHALTVVRRRMREQGQLIVAVEPPSADVQEAVTQAAGTAMRLQAVQTSDGKKWWSAFTGFEEELKGSGSVMSTFLTDMEQLFRMTLTADGIEGVILNPWNRTLMLDKRFLHIILGEEQKREKRSMTESYELPVLFTDDECKAYAAWGMKKEKVLMPFALITILIYMVATVLVVMKVWGVRESDHLLFQMLLWGDWIPELTGALAVFMTILLLGPLNFILDKLWKKPAEPMWLCVVPEGGTVKVTAVRGLEGNPRTPAEIYPLTELETFLNPADNTICYQKKWYRIGENTIENIYPPEKQHPWMDHPENKASGIIDVQRLMEILKGYEASLKAARKECEWMEKHGG